VGNSATCEKRSAAKRSATGAPLRGSPTFGGSPSPWMDGLRPWLFLKRGTPRRVAPPPRQKPATVRHQGTKAAGQPKPTTKARRPAGLRPDGKTKRGTCRAVRIDDRGKAWSKRPDRQAGRHGRKRPPLRGAKTGTKRGRPTSRPPAQPGACARHAGKVRGDRKTEKPVYQEEGGASTAH